ncbi:hypothetical protein EZI45_18950 [Delftia tsuruhatensis]|uniref:hypothetical protein n=1 Tax=Delftia TaxID=80865 RepID=UPI000353608C|nr:MULTISPECIES: hypothetical protein [Delftia]EPD39195.1 hypothetical protein HMPREF9701_03160 [Delftia acidovorans CCUG 274B]TDF26200.1 hypothetical protein EZI45_18950 [Delftia tsuruhatensis]
MSQAACLFRLVAMRRRAGGSLPQAMVWALGLLWRNHLASKRRQPAERRTEVERAARQRL